MQINQDNNIQLREAQLCRGILELNNPKIIQSILEKGANVNWIIPVQWLDKSIKLDFDCTVLHVAHAKKKIEVFQVLLDYGADFTIKNHNGSTSLHHIFDNLYNNLEHIDNWLHLDDPFVKMILSAHVKFANSNNPCDKNGLSHFHIACMANHIEAVKLFLNNGVLIDQIVNMDSSVIPGYHSLHIVSEFYSFETAKLLLSNGSNMHLKNANKLTPLHLLLKRRLQIFQSGQAKKNEKSIEVINKKKTLNEELINMFLENDTSCCDNTDDTGLSNFHVACTLQNLQLAECLLDQVADINHAVEPDSPFYPGYTGLHFAAHCNVDTVMMLIEKGADVTVKDVEGFTPLDIFMKWFSLQDIHFAITLVPAWNGILFSDGTTKLVDCILAMKDRTSLNEFLQKCNDVNMSVSNNSPLWPGYTTLHLAVTFSERFETKDEAQEILIKVCLDNGANVRVQSKQGLTPLHLALRQNKQQVMNHLLQVHSKFSQRAVNLSDEDGLSYLHISSVVKDRVCNFTRKLLSVKRDIKSVVNATYKGRPLARVKPGWTPLHVAAVNNNPIGVNMLLQHGANSLQTDSQGFTATHRLLAMKKIKSRAQHYLLASKQLEERVIESIGLTHLHVASWFDNAQAVRQLLEKGSDIEAVIEQSIENEDLIKFAGCRPLHMAMMNESREAVKELLQWGADIFAKKPDMTSPLSQVLTQKNHRILDLFLILLWRDDELQKSMEQQLGLTMLHIACNMGDIKSVRKLLKKGVDVNARARDDSNVWPGCTPLHMLMTKAAEMDCWDRQRFNILAILDVLLENGADMTVIDVRQCSPLLLILKNYDNPKGMENAYGNIILKHHRNFSINPVDNVGLSYFHLACFIDNFKAVEKFLQQACVDVNRPINFLATTYAGYTPLQLALTITYHGYADDEDRWNDGQRIAELLLKHGASIFTEDSLGFTPLHTLIKNYRKSRRRFNLMKKLLDFSNKSYINRRNSYGQTPMEILLSCRYGAETDEIKLLMDHGGRINSCNPMDDEGYIAIIYTNREYANEMDNIYQMIMKSPESSQLDEIGRNAIHNVVTTCNRYFPEISGDNYLTLIGDFIKLGCKIDHQDNCGKTPLHLAMAFRNEKAVYALLVSGADFNILDANGHSPFSYLFEPCMDEENWDRYHSHELFHRKYRLGISFLLHVEKLKFIRIEVDNENEKLYRRLTDQDSQLLVQRIFNDQVKATESVKIGQSDLTLRSFLCETGAISDFPSITPQERNEVRNFFENINVENFPEFKYILKLQYGKAIGRLSLVDPARDSLKTLLGFPLPYLCLEIILKYLSNSDLRKVMAATINDENMK